MKHVSILLILLMGLNLQCSKSTSLSSESSSAVSEEEKQLNDNSGAVNEAATLSLTDIYYIVPADKNAGLKLEEKSDFWDDNAGVAAIGVGVLAAGAIAAALHFGGKGVPKVKAPEVHPPAGGVVAGHLPPGGIRAPTIHPPAVPVTTVAKGAEEMRPFLTKPTGNLTEHFVKDVDALKALDKTLAIEHEGMGLAFKEAGYSQENALKVLNESITKTGISGKIDALDSLAVKVGRDADGNKVVYATMKKGDREVTVKTISNGSKELHVVQVRAAPGSTGELTNAFKGAKEETRMVSLKGEKLTGIQKLGPSGGEKSINELLAEGKIRKMNTDGSEGAVIKNLSEIGHNESALIKTEKGTATENFLMQANRVKNPTVEEDATFSFIKKNTSDA